MQAALRRRRLPVTTSVEDLLEYEYRRGLQVAILHDEPLTMRHVLRVLRVYRLQREGKLK